ncbi:hypothetical protein GCM10009844_09340 [Nocardioides koreensis]|uniref:Glycosyltransferase 2-like domain-containing protein n=1 Tax=Nocardioides koreensis TaxID=433651 RepID=A0ABN2ZCB7_9ACTN
MLGVVTALLIVVIGVRYLLYFRSYFFFWHRYRQLEPATSEMLARLGNLPNVKIQVTTRGTAGSLPVIERGLRNVARLVDEDPDLYAGKLWVEVFTESAASKRALDTMADSIPFENVLVVEVPTDYETPNLTRFKARGLHYAVELRRGGFNRLPGRTVIVHFDEESVMEPPELRKLLRFLATTDKLLCEGPIYYPFEYCDAGPVCRAMEAGRPINCYECRHVMESGVPLHLHGSNLVIDEELENRLGWDIGLTKDGQPFIAEDYVFGVKAYLTEGPEIFGWHGSVMLEQPPFSIRSAYRQRYRWVLGVLQGLQMIRLMHEFQALPSADRRRLLWGTRYRLATFALGLPAGVVSLLYITYQTARLATGIPIQRLPEGVMLALVFVGFLWLNSSFIGVWYNVSSNPSFTFLQRWIETTRVLAVAPVAGIFESAAAAGAVLMWALGRRQVSWVPTPKTKAADEAVLDGAAHE